MSRITLEEALTRAEDANLELRVARADLDAAEARIRSAGATREQLSGDGVGYDETSITLSQTPEIGGQRAPWRPGLSETVPPSCSPSARPFSPQAVAPQYLICDGNGHQV